ncbi:MAG: tail fiber domain-containing protein, partial [Flavobacterium sp.]
DNPTAGAPSTAQALNDVIVNASGDVGLGLLSPQQKLHLSGTNGIGFGSFASDKKLYSPSDGLLEWRTHSSAQDRAFAISDQGGNKKVYLNINGPSYFTGGNVGIGVTNPVTRLEVEGSLSTRLNFGIGSVRITPGGTGTSGYIEFYNPNSSTRAGYIGNANNGNLQYNAENGNRHYFMGGGIFVDSARSYSVGSYVFYSNNVFTTGIDGVRTGVSAAGTNNYSIYAVDRVACSEVNIFSDKRVKNVIGTSNANQDLATLMKISIKDYTMKDFIQNGDQKYKKVIAQEVEEVFPLAVNQGTNYIPNVFAPAKVSNFNKDIIEFILTKDHQLKKFDTLKVYIAGKEKIVTVASISSEKSFKVKNQNWSEETLKDVFVYGKLVHDFRKVDYDALSMLNISATQELYRKIEALEKQNEQLQNIQKVVLELKAEINHINRTNLFGVSAQESVSVKNP